MSTKATFVIFTILVIVALSMACPYKGAYGGCGGCGGCDGCSDGYDYGCGGGCGGCLGAPLYPFLNDKPLFEKLLLDKPLYDKPLYEKPLYERLGLKEKKLLLMDKLKSKLCHKLCGGGLLPPPLKSLKPYAPPPDVYWWA